MHDKTESLPTILDAMRDGYTLREATALAGIHVATLCRWQMGDPKLRRALRRARLEYRQERDAEREPRPSVLWRRDCPLCGAKVVVRMARGATPFWRCGRWPECVWASWRPRAPRNCRHCKAARFWSHSRKSISCSGCGRRTPAPFADRG